MRLNLFLCFIMALTAGCSKRVAGIAEVGPQGPLTVGNVAIPGPAAKSKPLVNNFSVISGRWNWTTLVVSGCSGRRDSTFSFPKAEHWTWFIDDKEITLARDGQDLRTLPYTWKVEKKNYRIRLKINKTYNELSGTFGSSGEWMIMEFYGSYFSEGRLGSGCKETLTFQRNDPEP